MVVIEKVTGVNTFAENPDFSWIKFGQSKEIDLLVHNQTGFFNATKLMAKFKRNLYNYQQTKYYLKLSRYLIESLEFGEKITFDHRSVGLCDQSQESGTYYHPILFLAAASWSSPLLYIRAAEAVCMFFNSSAERNILFQKTFAVKSDLSKGVVFLK